jgi:hypothetical protein
MTIREKHIVFIKNTFPAAEYKKGVCSAGFISVSGTVKHFYLTKWAEGGYSQ